VSFALGECLLSLDSRRTCIGPCGLSAKDRSIYIMVVLLYLMGMNRTTRYEATETEICHTISDAIGAYKIKLKDKGKGIFVSGHEIYGILQEEVDEFFTDVKANSRPERLRAELLDVIVAAMHGITSIDSGKLDW